MSANRRGIGSGSGTDLAKVDAYLNTPADYEELPEVTSEEMARAEPHLDGVRLRGRPPKGNAPKQQITLRLDRDVIDHYRRRGPGWQGKINEALRKSIGC